MARDTQPNRTGVFLTNNTKASSLNLETSRIFGFKTLLVILLFFSLFCFSLYLLLSHMFSYEKDYKFLQKGDISSERNSLSILQTCLCCCMDQLGLSSGAADCKPPPLKP